MKPWRPTIDHIKECIMSSAQGYGMTHETTDDGTTYHLVIWRGGKEQARYIGDSEKMAFYECYSALVREGKIKP